MDESILNEYRRVCKKQNNGIYMDSITKKYNKKFILNSVSFLIEEEKVVGLIGPNGAGKSTFFNILVSKMSKTSGKMIHK